MYLWVWWRNIRCTATGSVPPQPRGESVNNICIELKKNRSLKVPVRVIWCYQEFKHFLAFHSSLIYTFRSYTSTFIANCVWVKLWEYHLLNQYTGNIFSLDHRIIEIKQYNFITKLILLLSCIDIHTNLSA